MNKLSRRNFLKTGAMGLAGATLAGTPLSIFAQDSPENATIELWDFDSTGIENWVVADRNFAAYFNNKYPHLTTNRTAAPWGGYTERFLTSVAGGARYDVIYGWGAGVHFSLKTTLFKP